MNVEKWTLGMAAAGLISLSPALLAQGATPQLVPIQTALSATTISGYVDTSAVWNPGTGNANPAPYAFNAGKQDGFNLNAVDVKLAKALDEGTWGAGYVAEISYGPDAEIIDGGAYPLRQAYIELNTPVGNGLDWQFGRWDSLLGYESVDAMKNPNYTRSYGRSFEPTENTGLLASYKFCDAFSAQAGVADTVTTSAYGVNARATSLGVAPIESKKAFLGLLTMTAPESWGGYKGSELFVGWDYGQGAPSHDKSEIYVGGMLNTPIKGLTFGASWDGIFHNDVYGYTPVFGYGDNDESYFQSIAGYCSYKATEKLTLSARFEYADGSGLGALADENNSAVGGIDGFTFKNPLHKVLALTGTVQYQLWENVISRVEIRWDHAADGSDAFGGAPYSTIDGGVPDKKNEVTIAANMIYKF